MSVDKARLWLAPLTEGVWSASEGYVSISAEAFRGALAAAGELLATSETAYPYDEGDVTVLGPGVFVKRDGSVLNWGGVNYVPQEESAQLVTLTPSKLADLAQSVLGYARRPGIGMTVWYRSRTGAYTVPAMITATAGNLNRGAVEAGLIPDLSSPLDVHLTVFSPGRPEAGPNGPTARLRMEPVDAVEDAMTKVPPGAASLNLAGTYQEWNVPFFDPHGMPISCGPTPGTGEVEQLPGSWTWPGGGR